MAIIYCSFPQDVIPRWFEMVQEQLKNSKNVVAFHHAHSFTESLRDDLDTKRVDPSVGKLFKNERYAKPLKDLDPKLFQDSQTQFVDNFEFKALYVLIRADLVIADFNYPFGFEDRGVELMSAWLLEKRIIGVSNAVQLSPFLSNRCQALVKANSPILLEEVAKFKNQEETINSKWANQKAKEAEEILQNGGSSALDHIPEEERHG